MSEPSNIEEQYGRFLVDARGLMESSLQLYLRVARSFVSSQLKQGKLRLDQDLDCVGGRGAMLGTKRLLDRQRLQTGTGISSPNRYLDWMRETARKYGVKPETEFPYDRDYDSRRKISCHISE